MPVLPVSKAAAARDAVATCISLCSVGKQKHVPTTPPKKTSSLIVIVYTLFRKNTSGFAGIRIPHLSQSEGQEETPMNPVIPMAGK